MGLFEKIGISISVANSSRTSDGMWIASGKNSGEVIKDFDKNNLDYSLLKTGDLIFHDLCPEGDPDGIVDHIALYLVDGKIQHAAHDYDFPKNSEEWKGKYDSIKDKILQENKSKYNYETPFWVYIEDAKWGSSNIVGAKTYIS